MVQLNLSQLKLYGKLLERITNDPVAGVLNGLVISLTGDAHELLGFVRNNFPHYTGHDIQHSWRIIKRIEDILSPEAINSLSSVEIFTLIIAAAFHDIGMIDTELPPEEIRQIHHIKSDEFINKFLTQRMESISEYIPRLVKSIGFIARAHGMVWDDMVSNLYFKRPERILEQTLRVNVLSILLRIGDLLDLDSDRSCDPLRRFVFNHFIDKQANSHHDRHKHVTHFFCDPTIIEVEVDAYSKDEHTIWAEWLGYLKQDILHANTYIMKGHLSAFQLPEFSSKIRKAENSNYELWPLRFEIDDKGKIWEVISQSVYTGKFDFIRELIQNGIDACLRWIFINPQSEVNGCNPKYWSLKDYEPVIIINISQKFKTIDIVDNGIGMDKNSLKQFLFNVASSGYKKPVDRRDMEFPSIAKFGIGFVSCLVRAFKISIQTKSREISNEPGREVLLKTEALDAYSETIDCDFGTHVKLFLKNQCSFSEIKTYITENFYSPAVKLLVIDEDSLNFSLEQEKLFNKESIGYRTSELTGLERLMQISAIVSTPKIADYLKKNYSNRQFEKARNFYFEISPILGFDNSVITQPLFLQLHKNFTIKSSAKYLNNKTDSFLPSILLMPVYLIDNEIGIEWISMHGFLINRQKCVKTLIHLKTQDDGYNENILILTQEELEEYNNSNIENEGQGPERLYDSRDYYDDDDEDNSNQISFKITRSDPLFYMNEDESRITTKLNGIIISSIDGSIENQYELLSHLYVDIDRPNWEPNNPSKIEQLLGNLDNLMKYTLNNTVFQDGIKIPINANTIAPIGSTYARCNLFGNARLDLNVTRNSINESPVLLNNWMAAVGIKIQKAIISNLKTVLDSNNIQFDSSLFVRKEKLTDSNAIYEYSVPILQSLVKKM